MSEKRQGECARCGSCTVVCPVYTITGRESLTARGKIHLLGTDLAGTPSDTYQDLFSQCLLCGACEAICPCQLPIRDHVVEARSGFSLFYGRHGFEKTVARITLAKPGLLEGLVKAGISLKKLSILPENSGLRLKLGLLESEQYDRDSVTVPDEQKPDTAGEKASYFTGCLARYLQPSIARTTQQLYGKTSGKRLDVPDTQVCCGLAAWASGSVEETRALARKNISAFQDTSGPIITSCASCSSFLMSYPDLFEKDPEWFDKSTLFAQRIKEFASFFLDEQIERHLDQVPNLRLYYHEPCHLRFAEEKKDGPRELIDRLVKIRRVGDEDTEGCCGQGGLFHVGYPELANKIFLEVYRALQSSEAEIVVTTCSGCLMQWQAGLAGLKSDVPAVHLAIFLAECLDIEA